MTNPQFNFFEALSYTELLTFSSSPMPFLFCDAQNYHITRMDLKEEDPRDIIAGALSEGGRINSAIGFRKIECERRSSP